MRGLIASALSSWNAALSWPRDEATRSRVKPSQLRLPGPSSEEQHQSVDIGCAAPVKPQTLQSHE